MSTSHSIVLYYTDGFYEPGNRWYLSPLTGINQALANDLADAGTGGICAAWSYSRWTHLDSDGHKVDEGTLTGAGTFGGSKLPSKYCAFVRLNSDGPGKPSSKYLHGLSETMMTDGAPAADYLTWLAFFVGVLKGNGLMDSDLFDIESATFRSFSRRRHVRRLGE